MGSVRRIGSGDNTSIWHDPGLSDPENPYIESNIIPGLENETVATLKAEDGLNWDHDILAYLFSVRNRLLILRIPLPRGNSDDRWMWTHIKDGLYFVKLGYRLLLNKELTANNMYINTYNIQWQVIWDLNLPVKIKHHVWRILTGCLPTTQQLRIRQVEISATCQVCNEDLEDVFHAMVRCKKAKEVWSCSGLGDVSATATNISTWWIAWKTKAQQEEEALVLWGIWYNRNQMVWANTSIPARKIYEMAVDCVMKWRAANAKPTDNKTVQHTSLTKWERQSTGWRKCNVDASLDIHKNRHGYGWVLRYEEGLFLAAVHDQRQGVYTPNMVEAMGVREALSWLKDRQEKMVLIETDSLALQCAIRSNKEDGSIYGLIINDCKNLVLELDQVRIRYVSRLANIAAHSLARAAFSHASRLEWNVDPPIYLCNVLQNDII